MQIVMGHPGPSDQCSSRLIEWSGCPVALQSVRKLTCDLDHPLPRGSNTCSITKCSVAETGSTCEQAKPFVSSSETPLPVRLFDFHGPTRLLSIRVFPSAYGDSREPGQPMSLHIWLADRRHSRSLVLACSRTPMDVNNSHTGALPAPTVTCLYKANGRYNHNYTKGAWAFLFLSRVI